MDTAGVVRKTGVKTAAQKARKAARQRRYRALHKEKTKAQHAASDRRYYARHKEECLARNARWRAANPEKVKEQQRRYRTAHPERVREWNKQQYVERKFGLTPSEYRALKEMPKSLLARNAVDKVRFVLGLQGDAPDGARSVFECAKHWGVSVCTARDQLKVLVARGEMKVGKRVGESMTGKWRLMDHYWPASPEGTERVDKVRAAHNAEDDVPEGAITIREYVEHYKIPIEVAQRELRDLVMSGRMKVGRKRIEVVAGRRQSVDHYWPIEKVALR